MGKRPDKGGKYREITYSRTYVPTELMEPIMDKSRYTWHYDINRDEFPYEIRDNEDAAIIARCETKENVEFIHSLLAEDEARYCVPKDSRFGIFGTVKLNKPIAWK